MVQSGNFLCLLGIKLTAWCMASTFHGLKLDVCVGRNQTGPESEGPCVEIKDLVQTAWLSACCLRFPESNARLNCMPSL